MVPRPGNAREREIDFSAVGKIGRRTGAILAQRPIDENGLEEISHIFSSPRKLSPLKRNVNVHNTGASEPASPPIQALPIHKSARSTPRPPLSISPRKSGITGTARRSNGIDIHDTVKSVALFDSEEQENTPLLSPSRANRAARRFSPSPEKSPLRDITGRNITTALKLPIAEQSEPQNAKEHVTAKGKDSNRIRTIVHEADNVFDQENDDDGSEDAEESIEHPYEDGDVAPIFDDDTEDIGRQVAPVTDLVTEREDEEAGQTLVPEAAMNVSTRERTKANSTKKRRSDVFDEEDAEILISSPSLTKRQRQEGSQHRDQHENSIAPVSQLKHNERQRGQGRPPGRPKKPETQLSGQQQLELDKIIQKVQARPNQNKSLYILKRETPADDGVLYTRSGRISVKPLAYWRNERCVYGGSPSSVTISEGTRFPLNSIKEIIRTEEVQRNRPKKRAKNKRGKTNKQAKEKLETTDTSESEQDSNGEENDSDAETWETEVGAFRGTVSVWDAEQQAPIEDEEEIDIAYASAAIQTKEQKATLPQDRPSFRYAKLLSTRFFGTGLVDLPPGGIKRPKNSRKMHMSFFVVQGRVTVEVGPIGGVDNGTMNRFSIGKGGFWQVPRGNQYSIENELTKPARIFFSQGCEPSQVEE